MGDTCDNHLKLDEQPSCPGIEIAAQPEKLDITTDPAPAEDGKERDLETKANDLPAEVKEEQKICSTIVHTSDDYQVPPLVVSTNDGDKPNADEQQKSSPVLDRNDFEESEITSAENERVTGNSNQETFPVSSDLESNTPSYQQKDAVETNEAISHLGERLAKSIVTEAIWSVETVAKKHAICEDTPNSNIPENRPIDQHDEKDDLPSPPTDCELHLELDSSHVDGVKPKENDELPSPPFHKILESEDRHFASENNLRSQATVTQDQNDEMPSPPSDDELKVLGSAESIDTPPVPPDDLPLPPNSVDDLHTVTVDSETCEHSSDLLKNLPPPDVQKTDADDDFPSPPAINSALDADRLPSPPVDLLHSDEDQPPVALDDIPKPPQMLKDEEDVVKKAPAGQEVSNTEGLPAPPTEVVSENKESITKDAETLSIKKTEERNDEQVRTRALFFDQLECL